MFDSYPDVLKTSDVQSMLHIGKKKRLRSYSFEPYTR